MCKWSIKNGIFSPKAWYVQMLDQYTKKWSLLIKRLKDQWVNYHFYQKFMKEWYTNKSQIILNLFSMKFCVDLERK